LCLQVLKMADYMVKGFVLPECPRSVQSFVDRMRGCTFDSPDNFLKAERQMVLGFQWDKDHVNMVRHHHGNIEPHFAAVVVQAVLEYQVAGFGRKLPSLERIECYEVCAAGAFYVRQVAPVVVLANF